VSTGPAISRALFASLKEPPAKAGAVAGDLPEPGSSSWLEVVIAAVASADEVTRGSFVQALLSLLLSDDASGLWRIRRIGTAAPRADALTLDWSENTPAISSGTGTRPDTSEALLGTRTSLLSWNAQRRVVGVTESNRHFHHAPARPPPLVDPSVVSKNCTALGAALRNACSQVRFGWAEEEVGVEMHRMRERERERESLPRGAYTR
jgi:hypothetical protein